ncbi:sulfurtransferase [Vibrio parahaemolyticus]|nr:sulfurtransferase [Vibrio parahaemolyticus]
MNKLMIISGISLLSTFIGYSIYKATFSAKAVVLVENEQKKKFLEYAYPEHFISAASLRLLMEENNDVIVIGTLNPIAINEPISGSHTLWRNQYSSSEEAFGFEGMRSFPEDMIRLLSSFGATPESTIVVYAANSHHDAARLYWQIHNLGHGDIRYLDGGLNAWKGAGYPTGTEKAVVSAQTYTPLDDLPENNTLATLDMVVTAQNDPEWVIIDTRSEAEFKGERSIQGAYGVGAIPNSIHINWTEALNEDTSLKSKAELKAIYGDIIQEKNVIVYCHSGVRSAHTTMVLSEILNAKSVYNYDGSWIEYSHAYYEDKNPKVEVINNKNIP